MGPIDLACKLLPWNARLNLGLLMHIYVHAGIQSKFAGQAIKRNGRRFSKLSMIALLDDLKSAILSLRLKIAPSVWSEYYNNTNYSTDAMLAKEQIVRRLLEQSGAKTVWDIGANTGKFSRIAADVAKNVVAMDVDPLCTEAHYTRCRLDIQRMYCL